MNNFDFRWRKKISVFFLGGHEMTVHACAQIGDPPLALASPILPAGAPVRGDCHGVYLLGNNDPLWDGIEQDPSFSIYRKKRWKEIIEQTYGHHGEYIAAFENGRLVDLIPFFLVSNPLGHKKLISTPYQGSNGGFLCDKPLVRRYLTEYIKDFAKKLDVRYVEIRSAKALPELEAGGFVAKTPLLITILPLTDLEENWARLTPNHRRNVRLAEKSGVTLQVAGAWREMQAFYVMLADHYKGLGVPFPGEGFFRRIWDKLVIQGQGMLLLAHGEGELIGGHLLLYNGTTLVSKYSVTLHQERHAKRNAAYALYWEAIRRGVEAGFTTFDLGITGQGNTGLREFKSRLGGEEKPLYFYYYRLKGPLPDYERYYSSYQFARTLWKLAPKPLTNLAGDYINRWIC